MLRFVRPDVVTLDLSDGEWLRVRRRLTAGEERRMYGRMLKDGTDKPVIDPVAAGLAQVVAYLLDWSAKDGQGKKVEIDGLSPAELEHRLDGLDPDDLREVQQAIAQHVAAMDAEREAEKKRSGGATTSDKTSLSLVGAAGGTSG